MIDGFVYFAHEEQPALGTYLYNALGQRIPIIGVAKNAFKQFSEDSVIYRGKSTKALYVTSLGISLEASKNIIQSMHGSHRIPTPLKAADTACTQLKKESLKQQ